MPMTRVRARSVITFSEKPHSNMTVKVGINEAGMASAVIAVARQSRRKSHTTSEARIMPSSMVCRVDSKLLRVSITRLKIFWVLMPWKSGCLSGAPCLPF